jgi:O-antigen/teichoic acid export membrane protein
VLRRALGNAGKLLSGKSASGLMQLATLALAARTLGIRDFGLLSVMLAQIQLLIALATFQSNQAIVRYGVLHLAEGNRRGFQLLVKFGMALDFGAAAVAALAALLLAPLVAREGGWSGDYVAAAQLLALLPLANAIATPKGVLRLFGRFDGLAKQVTAAPLVRLLGAIVLSVTGGSLVAFAGLWVAGGIAGAMVIFPMAWREAGKHDQLAGADLSLAGATERNPGIWRFALLTNLQSSFALLPAQLGTILAGLLIGPAAAANVRVAQELGTALAKPIDLINQAVYPDIARLAAAREWQRLRRVIARAGVTAFGVGLGTWLILLVAGEAAITLIFGSEYAGAARLLLLFSAATAVQMSVFAVDPALYALGKPSRPLLTALAVNLAFIGIFYAAVPGFGLLAPGLAALAGSLAALLLSLLWVRLQIPRGQDR